MKDISHIEGFLLDLDGTVYIGEQIIPGAREAIDRIRRRGVPIRFTTNTTTRSTRALYDKLRRLGLEIREGEIFGTIPAAVRYLRRFGRPRCFFLLTDDPREDFAEFPEDREHPQFVVVGDIGKRWNYELVQQVFELLVGGAELVALHKGKFWQTEEGLRVDLGAFVAGLEYVSGKTAVVTGKPSKEFFTLAVEDLGLRPGEVAMVGDDIDSDVGGAQAAGLTGVLVKTGKYRPELAARSPVAPDLIVDSIAGLADLL